MESADPITIYNLPSSPPKWDALGIFYITFCAVWTLLVMLGMLFLAWNRRMPILRVRGLPLSLASITMLHVYWIFGQIVYPVGRSVPILAAYDVQYFCMGIWFPLGIALFQAGNSRFLMVARLQKQYARPVGPMRARDQVGRVGKGSWWARFRGMEESSRLLVYIGVGMVVQVILTVIMWLLVRKYHPTFGIPGTDVSGTIDEQVIQLGRGWEWWPTALWQLIWTWVVAPILIWRSWSIRDTLGWRIQTIGCCVSGLHAAPLFLAAMYLDAFYPVNNYFVPSQWIHLSVLMFEVFTIFVPCAQVLWLLRLRSKMSKLSARKWGPVTPSSGASISRSTISNWKSIAHIENGERLDDLPHRIWTMEALDQVLEKNPGPLQQFSALRDFSGENIAFLRRLMEWKASWPGDMSDPRKVYDAYNSALAMYADFISIQDAQFPINLSSKDLGPLEAMFEKQTRIVYGAPRINPITPFAGRGLTPTSARHHVSGTDSSDAIVGGQQGEAVGDNDIEMGGEMLNFVRYLGEIPEGFGRHIFDAAQMQVKYLVFTNTWPKFVHESRAEQLRKGSSGSDSSNATRWTATTG